MLDRIISGGQSGADQAALRAACSAGVPTGGTAPRLWLAEVANVQPDGTVRWVHRPEPKLMAFGLVECNVPKDEPADRIGKPWTDWCACAYRARTKVNATNSDGTVWFGSITSRGWTTTNGAAVAAGRPLMIVYQGITKPSDVRAWIEAKGVRVLNVAGNRESTSPGIGERVERFIGRVFAVSKKDAGHFGGGEIPLES